MHTVSMRRDAALCSDSTNFRERRIEARISAKERAHMES
jgi:hypothetical protein